MRGNGFWGSIGCVGRISALGHSGGQREPRLNFSGFEDLNGVSQLHSQRIRLRRFRSWRNIASVDMQSCKHRS
jgi:hypothetical protein